MFSEHVYRRFLDLQKYVGWTEDDAARIVGMAPLLAPALPAIIEDFYAELQKHPETARVITGGAEQVERLKRSLTSWIEELLSGHYDESYVRRRWLVGKRHVEIGLSQVYTNAAISRLRTGLMAALEPHAGTVALPAAYRSLSRLIDLDLAIIEEAYQSEHLLRQQRIERLATIGQVAGGIAHELRNPLNVIRTSVYYLRNAQRLTPEKTAEHLDRIEKQVGVGDSVITALSNFARLPMPESTAVSLTSFFAELLQDMTIPESVAIQVIVPEGTPPALADSRQLQIVFSNLIRNACDAMSDGGQLTVRVTSPPNDGIDVTVHDTGHGISPEHLKRITEPFFSTKARGIGLGLALSRAILEKNNGQLSVESRPGVGTAFTVRLPSARSSS